MSHSGPADLSDTSFSALALARSGDLPGAIAAGEAAIEAGSRDPGLTLFVGVLCCRLGRVAQGIGHLRRAVELAPAELAAKVELARALISTAAYADACAIAAPHALISSPIGREMQRIVAHALLRGGQLDDARALYDQLTEADPDDFESWHGLGLALLEAGDAKAAIDPLTRAAQLRPAVASYWIVLARAGIGISGFVLAEAAARRALALDGSHPSADILLGEALIGLYRPREALAQLTIARHAASSDASLLCEIADAEMRCKAIGRAENSYRASLALDPGFAPAIIGLGKLFERTNRIAELDALLVEADKHGVMPEATALLRARVLRSGGDLRAALAAARGAPQNIEAVRRAQLIGDIADRLGDADGAFAAFEEANATLAADVHDADRSERYYRKVCALSALLTPQWYASWSAARPSGDRKAPLFIFGFPRSGTTLIDTMLGGHSAAVLLEEEAVIHRTADRLRSAVELRDLTGADIDRYRQIYFGEVDRLVQNAPARLVIDKDPLGLISTPLLHRMFPDARYVFAQRHPCDVVLSCFTVSAQFNLKLGHFFDLERTARLYDKVLGLWERCCDVFPLAVHTIRYERLVEDPQTELRQLANFAGLEWEPRLMNNQSNAAARSFIASPSYAQVGEPLYRHASGRWLRYRRHMEPVLPILAPWIEKMGYDFG